MKSGADTVDRDSAPVIVRDGAGLGWGHLRATAYQCVRGGDSCALPASSEAYLIKVQTSASPVDLEWNYAGSEKARWDRGTMALLPMGESTHWHWTAPLETLIFGVGLDFWNSLASDVFGRDGVQAALIPKFRPQDPALRQLLLMLAEEFYAGAPNGPLYADGLSIALVTRLLRRHSSQPTPVTSSVGNLPGWKLKRIIDYVDTNLDKRISIADIASVADMSPAYMVRIFRRTTGVSLYQYVLRQRVLRAMGLITNSDMPLNNIATTTGFSSHSQFTTTFRRVTQMTPSTFQRMK